MRIALCPAEEEARPSKVEALSSHGLAARAVGTHSALAAAGGFSDATAQRRRARAQETTFPPPQAVDALPFFSALFAASH